MKTYEKNILHRGHHFVITVTLNYKIERRINGNTYHKIHIVDLTNTTYSFEFEVATDFLQAKIDDIVANATKFVDDQQITPLVAMLEGMGFAETVEIQ